MTSEDPAEREVRWVNRYNVGPDRMREILASGPSTEADLKADLQRVLEALPDELRQIVRGDAGPDEAARHA